MTHQHFFLTRIFSSAWIDLITVCNNKTIAKLFDKLKYLSSNLWHVLRISAFQSVYSIGYQIEVRGSSIVLMLKIQSQMNVQLSVTHWRSVYVTFWMQISQKITEFYYNFNWIDVNNNTKIVDNQIRGIIYYLNRVKLTRQTERTISITKQQGPSRMTDNWRHLRRRTKEREREREKSNFCYCSHNNLCLRWKLCAVIRNMVYAVVNKPIINYIALFSFRCVSCSFGLTCNVAHITHSTIALSWRFGCFHFVSFISSLPLLPFKFLRFFPLI